MSIMAVEGFPWSSTTQSGLAWGLPAATLRQGLLRTLETEAKGPSGGLDWGLCLLCSYSLAPSWPL